MDKPRPPKTQEKQRKPLRQSVAEIDQEILRLLMRRTNLIAKMREKGHLPVADEKFLREAWQNDVARVSRDPELSGRFFALMQQITFLPRPTSKSDEDLPGAQRRKAFNLAPPEQPIHASLVAPLAQQTTIAWLYLAAASGQALTLEPCLQNDALVDFVQGLAQVGAAITREDDAIITRSSQPLATPDKVIHAGSSEFGFYIFIAHYLGRYSRVKITGANELQLKDFSSLRQFLPGMGARLINIIPKSDSLPIRLESSGILPAGITPGSEIDPQFIEALCLAAPFYEAPFAIDLAKQPQKASILAHIVPLLKASGAVFSLQGNTISFEPSELLIPPQPKVAIDPELAAFLLAFGAALGGEVELKGIWVDWPENEDFWQLCLKNGYRLQNEGIKAAYKAKITSFNAQEFQPSEEWQTACVASLAAAATLNGGSATLNATACANIDVTDFMRICGLSIGDDGSLALGKKHEGLAWNAPSPAWAVALAVAACCRREKQGWPLGNPGIITEIWPAFWAFYNSLPDPKLRQREEKPAQPEKQRRRIITNAIAVPPEIREEDWG